MTAAGTKIKKMRLNQVCRRFRAIPRNSETRYKVVFHIFRTLLFILLFLDNHPLQLLQQKNSPLEQNHACIPGVSMVKC